MEQRPVLDYGRAAPRASRTPARTPRQWVWLAIHVYLLLLALVAIAFVVLAVIKTAVRDGGGVSF